MASVWAELRRRNVFRVAAAYAVVGWLIIQVASALSSPLSLPGWFEAVVVALLAIGFPLASPMVIPGDQSREVSGIVFSEVSMSTSQICK